MGDCILIFTRVVFREPAFNISSYSAVVDNEELMDEDELKISCPSGLGSGGDYANKCEKFCQAQDSSLPQSFPDVTY